MKRILFVIDVQNDFLETGSLPIQNASSIIPKINTLMCKFDRVIASQDWHPENHSSFKKQDGSGIWPIHCLQKSKGAEFAENLHSELFTSIIRKGFSKNCDSYSMFYDENLRNNDFFLHESLINQFELYFCGLALDFCVGFSVKDALKKGFRVCIIEDACKAVGNFEESINEFIKLGAKTIKSAEIGNK